MPAQSSVLPFISADEVDAVLDFPGLVDALQSAHKEQALISDSLILELGSRTKTANSFLSLPAWAPGKALGAKLATVFPNNPAVHEGVPAVHAIYPIFSGETGEPLAIIDGTQLTYWKTAADSALGSKLLARKTVKQIAMLGAGDLAPWLVRAHVAIHPGTEQVIVWNRTIQKASAVAAKLTMGGINAEVSENIEDAVRNADIVCAATAATRPFLKGAWLKPGVHVDLVGSFTPEMRESDDDTVRGARVFMDAGIHALETGDLKEPIKAGILEPSDIPDLYALCGGAAEGRQSDQDITLFKNGGGAHLDLMTAMYILHMRNKCE
ncbi:MAG: ornithine cyclodeaminase family protein [Hyphomicrobiales bacterium]